jgi:hypothetical protein
MIHSLRRSPSPLGSGSRQEAPEGLGWLGAGATIMIGWTESRPRLGSGRGMVRVVPPNPASEGSMSDGGPPPGRRPIDPIAIRRHPARKWREISVQSVQSVRMGTRPGHKPITVTVLNRSNSRTVGIAQPSGHRPTDRPVPSNSRRLTGAGRLWTVPRTIDRARPSNAVARQKLFRDSRFGNGGGGRLDARTVWTVFSPLFLASPVLAARGPHASPMAMVPPMGLGPSRA